MSKPPSARRASSTSFVQNDSLMILPGNGNAFFSGLLDQSYHVFRVFLLALEVVKRNIGALAGERNSSSSAYTRIRSRDESLAARQTTEALIAILPMIGFGIHLLSQARRILYLLWKSRSRILLGRVLHRILIF